MKKSLFFAAAASALMLTACSSENDVVQNTTPQTTVQNQAVGFDIYTPAATNVTRAGLEGTMTTDRLQRSEANGGGFGVYAYLTEDADNTAAATTYGGRTTPVAPNFMVNEKLLWNSVNQGWYYNPLKYWPNETNNDSQSSAAEMTQIGSSNKHLDRLTFFAYAPYISAAASGVPGITQITDNQGKLGGAGSTVEASIGYQASLDDPNKAVDLLWGVAPAGGLTYTAVNGQTVNVPEGQPLIDMTKPNVNTNMKFLFQHALARIGVKAVAAIDQVGAGGKLDPNTRITIKSITLTGYFGETGLLNLDNPTPNVANWVEVNGKDIKNTSASAWEQRTITIGLEDIAEHLKFVGDHATPQKQADRIGVTTVKQDVLAPATIAATTPWYTSKTYTAGQLAYSETTPYYTEASSADGKKATSLALPAGTYYTLSDAGVYTAVTDPADTWMYPQVVQYYTGAFTLVTAGNKAGFATKTAYTLSGATYTPKADIPAEGDYVITTDMTKAVPYYDAGTYYKRDANFFMVVPTNNFKVLKPSMDSDTEKALRTVRVKITYYITTEDSKLYGATAANQVAQTENVIEKDVVFPSIANGKSYNLNLILGLTSVKMEAGGDDWKVINVQGDLPQNTAE